MTFRIAGVLLFGTLGCFLPLEAVWAQGIGGGGRPPSGSNLTSGLGFGNQSFGSSTGLGSGSLGGGLGQSGFGAGGLGQGGFGQSGFGQSGFGAGGFGSGGGFGQSTSGFIGRDSADVASMFESLTRQGQQFSNRTQRSNNANNRRGANANSDAAGETTPQDVRVKLKVAFDVPEAAETEMAIARASQLTQLLSARDVADVALMRDGDVVVVEGIAADSFERKLVEQLIAQQPGVVRVVNRMTLAEPIAAPTPRE